MGSLVRAAHPALRRLVTPYHGYRYAGLAPGVHHGLPSTELTMVIAFDEPLDVGWLGEDSSRGQHWALTSGLHNGPALIRHGGFQHGIQLGLTPLGARVILGRRAGDLATALVSLDLLGRDLSERMYEEVAGAATWEQRFVALDRHLLAWAGRTETRSPIRGELQWAWRRLERSAGTARVERLAAETGWSRRHFSARFRDEFGLGPKQVARVLRFQRARSRLAGSGGVRLAEVASECGYADQAHLTREWRELAGYSPAQWRREELPFLQDHGPVG